MKLEAAKRKRVSLSPIDVGDIDLVDRLLDDLQQYSMNVDGVAKMADGARHFLTATPPGYDAALKYVYTVKSKARSVGLVDIIKDFPRKGVAFIGLLAIAETYQGQGFGRAALKAVESIARSELGAERIRLAVVATNPVEGFWKKMGFTPTGEKRPYSGELIDSTVKLMEKHL